jgi:eukaryotic-like serine/threonine-protein kinase
LADLLTLLQDGLAGSYTIERELGGGGMSRVFVATETELGRKVVLKILPPELGAGFNLDRFRREIQMAASFSHPHIVPLYAAGQAAGIPYYTMPLIEGESLRAKLARDGELPINETVRLLRDVVDALACAHEHGVVHRDIKPDNVLVSRNHAVVTDFGVAKALEASGTASLTSTGMALGTPTYMAPEQAAGDPHIDHRADIYAAGVLAYEMLTGHPPFTGPTAQSVLAAHVTQAPYPITAGRATVPPALASLVMRCLEKRPADRWQSAEELLHQLESVSTPSGATTPTTAVAPAATSGTVTPSTGTVGTATPRFASPFWHRSGYLVLGVAIALAAAWGITRSRSGPPTGAAGGAKRVVVLPFENLGDSSRQYFANGVTEAITTQLTGLAGLSVIPRSTAVRYKGTQKSLADIGRELGVSYVLAGTVQWEDTKGGGNRVRVSPELIRISDTSSVWAHAYEAGTASVFQVYSDVAEQVAKSLTVALDDPERRALALRPTSNTEAYDLYLRATDYLNRGISADNFRTGLPMLERAVALDSAFALAWGRLGEGLALSHWLYINRTDQTLVRSKAAAERALALQPDLPEAHRAMGSYYYWGRRDYAHALEEFAIAQRSRPNSVDLLTSVGYVERRQGRWEEAAARFAKRLELDPGSPLASYDLGETLWLMRRFDDAERATTHGIETAPDEPDSYSILLRVKENRGNIKAAREVLQQALARMKAARMSGGFRPEPYVVVGDSALRREFEAMRQEDFGGDSAGYYFFRAEIRRLANDPGPAQALNDSARVVLERKVKGQPDDYGFHARLGLNYARLGRFPEAIQEGKKALELLPPTRDAYFGGDNTINLARIYAAAGQAASAVELLKSALAVPSRISPAGLRIDPDWDPIRSDPAFQKLLISP